LTADDWKKCEKGAAENSIYNFITHPYLVSYFPNPKTISI